MDMPHVQVIINSGFTGSSVKIDGVDIPELRRISVTHDAGEPPTVNLEINGFALAPGVILDGPAKVHVTIVPLPGYRVISRPLPDGTTEYTTYPLT